MKKKKNSMPSNLQILTFWCSKEGKAILENYGIKPYGIHTLTIDAGEECWCCDVFCCPGYYNEWQKDKLKNEWFDTRERCHIVAKSLGGTYECDNLFLMCPECHRRSPNTTDPKIFFEWVVKTNQKSLQYRKELTNGLCGLAKELFRETYSPIGEVDLESERYKKWVAEIHRFHTEFHGKDFSNYCNGKITAHGWGGRYHPDLLASELGLYKQYCIANQATLFPNL